MLRWLLIFAYFGWTAAAPCQAGGVYDPHLAKCLHLYNVPLDWLQAERTCENIGGRLVSIKSSYEQNFVWNTAQQQMYGIDFWTSGSDINHKGTWTWLDQTDIGYQNWAPLYPTYDENRDDMRCVYMENGGSQWKDDSCLGSKKAVACQAAAVNPPDLTNWTYFDETNAYYKPLNKSKSWDDFEQTCQSEGGHLTSIHRERENQIVIQVGLNIPECEQWAIGLRSPNFSPTYNWTWTDGSPYDYNNWHGNNPTDNGQPCGFLRFYDEGWMNQWCTYPVLNMCAVCKKPGPPQ